MPLPLTLVEKLMAEGIMPRPPPAAFVSPEAEGQLAQPHIGPKQEESPAHTGLAARTLSLERLEEAELNNNEHEHADDQAQLSDEDDLYVSVQNMASH